jgi:3-oxoadipate enol-lactonase
MSFVKVNGAVVHYRDEGPRETRAVVLTNALGADLRIWDEFAPPLAERWRVVRYDKRGHGLSELPPGQPLMSDYADDLAALLDRLGVASATVVGLSIGGLIAQALYRRRPDLVAALVLCGTAAKIGTEESWRQRIDEVTRGGIEAIADTVLQRWFTADFRARRGDELAGWRLMLTRAPRDGYLAACGAQQRADLRADCARIRAPTLCAVGDEDGSTPVALVRGLAEAIPGARFEVVAGAGHLLQIEQGERLRGLIEALAAGA